MIPSRKHPIEHRSRFLQSGAGRAQEGQSITELALFFPVLLLIMVGMLDLGRAFHVYTTVVNAAREGARYGAFYPDDDFGIQDAVVQEATGSNINLSLATIIVEKPSGVGSGNPIRVTVTFQFDPVTTLVVGANTIGISGSASMPQF